MSSHAKETISWNDPGLHKFLANFAHLQVYWLTVWRTKHFYLVADHFITFYVPNVVNVPDIISGSNRLLFLY